MPEKLRATGIDLLGGVPWGTDFCQFYDTADDLAEILVPYFKAGLESNEFCMWICSEPLEASRARRALKAAVPGLDGYLKKGQIEILPHDEWYLRDGAFDSQRVLDGWVGKLNAALAAGYDGLRLAGNMHWLESGDWADFTAYEHTINSVIGRYHMLAASSYALGKCGAAEIVDAVSNHQFALIRRQGRWQRCENPDRRRAAQSVRLQDEIAANMAEGVSLTRTSDGVIVYANPRFEGMFGYEPGEMVGRHVSIVNAATEKSPEETAGEIMASLVADGHWRGEVRNTRKDGTPFWCHASVARFDHPEYGEVALTVQTDITDRKRAEEALRESEERFRRLAATMPDAVLVGQDGRNVYANPSAARLLLAAGPEELVGLDVFAIIEPAQHERARQRMQRALAGEEQFPFEDRFVRLDGSLVPVGISVSLLTWQGRPALQTVVRDITDRKKGEQELRASESRLRSVYEAAENVAFVISDLSGREARILEFSPGAERIFGYRADEIVGRPLARLHLPEDAEWLGRVTEKMRRTKTGLSQEAALVRKSGEHFPAILTTYPLFDASGEMTAVLGVSIDITEQKQAEHQLRQSQKMEAIGRLAGGVAHDFRNQLAIIRGYSEMLLRRSHVDERGREMVNEILGATSRSAQFTSELLAFSRAEALDPQATALCELVRDMSEAMKKMIGEDVELRILACDDPCIALLDPRLLHQSLLNLATNARDAMPDVGTLTIESKPVEVDAAEAARSPNATPGEYIMLSVTDTGEGMDEKTKARAFEPFFTTKEVGTGLGLSMVHGFVSQSGGFVEIDSAPGQGTTLRLYFPTAASPHESETPKPDSEDARGGTETILVTEDEGGPPSHGGDIATRGGLHSP